jgi:hypothetical protein
LPEQEKVISSLATQDAAQTDLYLKIFLVLPVLTAALYIPALFTVTSRRDFAQIAFCISSLLSTALTLFRHGPIASFAELFGDASSSAFYVPALNAVLSGLLALQATLVRRDTSVWPPTWVPAAVFWLVLIVRYILRPVDVAGLERMRYQYKGA